ncbi:TRAP transporter substrate-binding protein DctP [uncultured Desulfuromusa sp.]|uniref:TRAP transporter substrate-binding protein n=1 Tax=uncultured Desulfuromusa sp. TaxID=219183 RepID=UPI002AA68050|nr:TRAP transporter substrate-binding protein DctP [uncultured Desulfuromusa sp.]
MRKLKLFIGLALILTLALAPNAFAAKREKFGADDRRAEVKKELRTIKPSTEKFKWKMVMPWSKGLLFYDVAQHFADSVKLASGGRLDIKLFSAGELVGAMESFDAVSKGQADIGHDWPGYWKGKNEAFVAFASVPMGLDTEGYNIWLFERGGLEMMQEIYGRFNLYALPGGNVGQELGLFSNKKASTMEDFKGMRVRTAGWYMDILTNLGASVTPLPGGEVYLALERGVIDAAEFSVPAMNYPMGFDDVTKYVIEPGVHQPSCQSAFFINQDSWNKLPADLQWIVKIAATETQQWSTAWAENLNAQAVKMFKEKVEFIRMDEEAINGFAKASHEYLESLKAKYPDVKKILDSQDEFKKDFADWREERGGITPWPYEQFIEGKHKQ